MRSDYSVQSSHMAPLCYAPQSAGPVLVLRHSRARAVEGMCRPCRRVGFHNFRLYARRKKTDDSSDPTSSKKKLAELREDRERLEANMLEMGVMGIQKAFQGRDSDKNEENAQVMLGMHFVERDLQSVPQGFSTVFEF